MVCGCLYIYERFTKEDEKVNKYTDLYTDRNAGNDVAPVANDSNADFFISLHCNYYEKDAQIAGLECYYNNSNVTESKGYGEQISRFLLRTVFLQSQELLKVWGFVLVIRLKDFAGRYFKVCN